MSTGNVALAHGRVAMKSRRISAAVIVAVVLAVSMLAAVGSRAVFAQDAGQAKYDVRVPNGLAFSEFRGYEGWADGLRQ